MAKLPGLFEGVVNADSEKDSRKRWDEVVKKMHWSVDRESGLVKAYKASYPVRKVKHKTLFQCARDLGIL